MSSGAFSGFVSGAAQGAGMGAMFGGGAGALIGGAIGGLSGLFSGGANDAAMANQMAWAQYNASMKYGVDMQNINNRLGLSMFNAMMSMAAAKAQSQAQLNVAAYNARMIAATTQYNIALLDNELSLMWEAEDLDQLQLHMYRERERGSIVGAQAASGTVIGEGSNAVVIQDQMTQEALDSFVIRHNADIQASKIHNQMAQSAWEGRVAIQKTMWEGQVGAAVTMSNAKMQAMGTLVGAGLQAQSARWTAGQDFLNAGYRIQQAQYNYSRQNDNALVQGLFSAAGTVAEGYFADKLPFVDDLLGNSGTGFGGGWDTALSGSSAWDYGLSGSSAWDVAQRNAFSNFRFP